MKLIIYRIFSFLLVPVAVLFGLSVLMLFSTALSNPAMLFPVFLLICIVIYSFAALRFLLTGIDGRKYLGRRFKDLLKVNAFISIGFAVLIISECTVFIIHPETLQQLTTQAMQTATANVAINKAEIESYLRIMCYFFLVYAIVLFIHIITSLQYIKQYGFVFENDER